MYSAIADPFWSSFRYFNNVSVLERTEVEDIFAV
jgi:hypothetical protein